MLFEKKPANNSPKAQQTVCYNPAIFIVYFIHCWHSTTWHNPKSCKFSHAKVLIQLLICYFTSHKCIGVANHKSKVKIVD